MLRMQFAVLFLAGAVTLLSIVYGQELDKLNAKVTQLESYHQEVECVSRY